jgi:hypothetical protein
MTRRLRIALWLFAAALAALAVRAAVVVVQSRQGPGDLAIRWEGYVNDHNARDLGASLNACLGEPLFRSGLVTRAAQWFSGWSCSEVGAPDVILSLNHKPAVSERYYCRAGDHNVVGLVSDATEELNDLEFLETWNDPVQRASACWYLNEGLAAVAAGRHLLVHCDAGRDRTGTYAALLAGLAAESADRLDARTLDAIECDYRKSESLVRDKYGRMRTFLSALQSRGGVARFLRETCGTDPALVAGAAKALLAAP